MENKNYQKIVYQVSIVTIIGNLLLSILKLLTGIMGKSTAMISDGIHSASDVLSTFVVIISVKLSSKKADEEHPYGHERMETIASLLLAILLVVVGLGIGIEGMKKILASGKMEIPLGITLYIALFSILLKEGMYWYTRKAAKKIHSDVLMADAWHHRSDALSSIGSFIGILGARLGFPVLDPIACVIICFFILKIGYDIGYQSIEKLIDKSCDKEIIEQLQNIILKNKEVIEIGGVKTRLFGNKIYADIEIILEGKQNLNTSCKIAKQIHNKIENEIEEMKHCNIILKAK